MINFEELIKSLILPLVVFPNDFSISTSENEGMTNFDIAVNTSDVGRVIGKNGAIISAIRTILNAAATKEGSRVRLNLITE